MYASHAAVLAFVGRYAPEAPLPVRQDREHVSSPVPVKSDALPKRPRPRMATRSCLWPDTEVAQSRSTQLAFSTMRPGNDYCNGSIASIIGGPVVTPRLCDASKEAARTADREIGPGQGPEGGQCRSSGTTLSGGPTPVLSPSRWPPAVGLIASSDQVGLDSALGRVVSCVFLVVGLVYAVVRHFQQGTPLPIDTTPPNQSGRYLPSCWPASCSLAPSRPPRCPRSPLRCRRLHQRRRASGGAPRRPLHRQRRRPTRPSSPCSTRW